MDYPIWTKYTPELHQIMQSNIVLHCLNIDKTLLIQI